MPGLNTVEIRYAHGSDFGFLLEGLEKNRVIENRPKKDIKAKASDKKEFGDAIRKKTVRIVEDCGAPVAFLYFRTDFKVMYVYDRFFWVDLIYVKETHRGMGLGKMLYEDAIGIAKRKGYKKIVIDIFRANENSIGFHRKLGFEPMYTIYQKRI